MKTKKAKHASRVERTGGLSTARDESFLVVLDSLRSGYQMFVHDKCPEFDPVMEDLVKSETREQFYDKLVKIPPQENKDLAVFLEIITKFAKMFIGQE